MTEVEIPDIVCKSCRQPVVEGAKKCDTCGSFQDWRRHLPWLVNVTSLVGGVILAVPVVFGAWKWAFFTPPVDTKLVTIDLTDGALIAQVLNRGTEFALLDGDLTCKEDHAGPNGLNLTVVSQGNQKIISPPQSVVTLRWDIWNVYVDGGRSDPLEEQNIENVLSGLLDDFPSDTGFHHIFPEQEMRELRNSVSDGPFAPMYKKFRYYLVLAARLKLASNRERPDQFEFNCQFDVENGTENPPMPEFYLAFSPYSYSLTSDFKLD